MKSNLERMLREVQELKRQNFGIPLPTKDAYRFVKSQEAYEGLRKGVAERLKAEGRRCNLTRRNVANLCDSILDFASQALDQVAKRTAASQPNNNYMPKDLHLMAFNPLLESSRDYLEKLNEKVIDFDYETLIYYYVKASEDANPEEAFRIAFREFYDGDHQFLIIEERKMSYPEFCKDANLHLEQNPGLDREDMGYDENEEQIREFESWLNQGSDFMNKK